LQRNTGDKNSQKIEEAWRGGGGGIWDLRI